MFHSGVTEVQQSPERLSLTPKKVSKASRNEHLYRSIDNKRSQIRLPSHRLPPLTSESKQQSLDTKRPEYPTIKLYQRSPSPLDYLRAINKQRKLRKKSSQQSFNESVDIKNMKKEALLSLNVDIESMGLRLPHIRASLPEKIIATTRNSPKASRLNVLATDLQSEQENVSSFISLSIYFVCIAT